MSTDAVTPLRQRMIDDMNARKLGAHSQRSHIYSCKRLAAFLKRSPDTATLEDIRRFQLHLAETGASICNRNRIMTGLRFLFRVTLRRLDLAAEIYHIREPRKIPQRLIIETPVLDLVQIVCRGQHAFELDWWMGTSSRFCSHLENRFRRQSARLWQ